MAERFVPFEDDADGMMNDNVPEIQDELHPDTEDEQDGGEAVEPDFDLGATGDEVNKLDVRTVSDITWVSTGLGPGGKGGFFIADNGNKFLIQSRNKTNKKAYLRCKHPGCKERYIL